MPDNIGEIKCSVCGDDVTAYIRKKKKGGGNYPLYLSTKEKGPDFYNTRQGQEWILDNGKFYDENGNLPGAAQEAQQDAEIEQEAAPVNEAAEEIKPEITQEAKPEKANDSGWIM